MRSPEADRVLKTLAIAFGVMPFIAEVLGVYVALRGDPAGLVGRIAVVLAIVGILGLIGVWITVRPRSPAGGSE